MQYDFNFNPTKKGFLTFNFQSVTSTLNMKREKKTTKLKTYSKTVF